ncbi:MAG: hypothetical protein ACE5O2_01865 [Armatimonadota bacterium]
MQEYMREIVDVAAFERALLGLAVVAPLAGLVVGAAVGARKGCAARGLVQGLAVGMLGPVVYGLWHVYDYLTRYDPDTGYAGLHRVSALAWSALIFAAVGVACGLGLRALFRAAGHERPTENDA